MRQSAGNISVRFWGVRGSVPSPGPHTVRYGGNTPCVSIDGEDFRGNPWTLMLDAGTGARNLGKELYDKQHNIFFFLTHTHWDHIQGFPFFSPIYKESTRIYLSRLEERKGLFNLLLEQMDGLRFPIKKEQIVSQFLSISQREVDLLGEHGYSVDRIRVNHPGETHGFRLNLKGLKIVYIPDNEIMSEGDKWVTFEELVAFCADADLLIHDAQYFKDDVPQKKGWGHSIIENVWELAYQANVKHLVCFHHDPDRSDDELDEMLKRSKEWFAEKGSNVVCDMAYEGLEMSFMC